MDLKLEFSIVKKTLTDPRKAIELLDANPSYFRILIYLLLNSTFFSLNYLYGSYIGNPAAYWLIALPYVVPYNALMNLLMCSLLTAFGMAAGKGEYPAGNLLKNLLVIVLIPQNVLVFLGLALGIVCSIFGTYYLSVTFMEYSVLLAAGFSAILSACILNATRDLPEHVSLFASMVAAMVFVVVSLLFFISLFATRVYSV